MLIPYEQIVWVYKNQHKTNGVTDSLGLFIGTKDGHSPAFSLQKIDYESNSAIKVLAGRLSAATLYGCSTQNPEAYRNIVNANIK